MQQEMYDLPFRASDYEPSEGFTPVPMGDYPVIVTDAQICRNRNQNGHLFKVTYQITEGEYANRKLWSQHNIDHPSEEAQHIARCEVSALAHAINRPEAERMQDYLHGGCQVGVVIREDPGYPPQNVIKSWKTADGQKPQRRAVFQEQRAGQERHRPVPGTAQPGTQAGMEGQAATSARPFERAQGESLAARTASRQPSARAGTGRPDGQKLASSETTHREHPQENTPKDFDYDDDAERAGRLHQQMHDNHQVPLAQVSDEDRNALQMALDSIVGCSSLEQLEQCSRDLEGWIHPELKEAAVRVYRERRAALEG